MRINMPTCLIYNIYLFCVPTSYLYLTLNSNITFIILLSRTYTQYTIVVQAFNKLGAGPMSDEIKQYTSEGVPEQPPHDTTCTTLTSQTIRISWVSPPLSTANGVIKGYKVIYGPSDSWFSKCYIYFQLMFMFYLFVHFFFS